MKIFYLLISLLSLLLIGCSSTYKVTDFPSRDKFYNDFNKSADNKILQVTLNNDSTFTAASGALISNDSLVIIMQSQREEKLSRNEINSIKYSGSVITNLSDTVFLKDGSEAIAKKINIISDSSIIVVVSESSKAYFPINKIRTISYKNNFIGSLVGFLPGSILGFITGLIVTDYLTVNNDDTPKTPSPLLYMPIIGSITGIIWGWNVGWVYTYQFNP
ncbi:MAG: hypothetical protein WCA84_12375 [Ignavibacteriaceae bacterium]